MSAEGTLEGRPVRRGHSRRQGTLTETWDSGSVDGDQTSWGGTGGRGPWVLKEEERGLEVLVLPEGPVFPESPSRADTTRTTPTWSWGHSASLCVPGRSGLRLRRKSVLSH